MRDRAVVVIISVLIIADLVTGLLYNLNFGLYRVGILLKSLILFFTFIVCLPLIRKKSLFTIYLSLGILFIFWITASLTSFYNNPEFDFGYSVIVLSRYLLFLVLSCVFVNLVYDRPFEEKCKRIFEAFFWVNNTFIILGFLFNIEIFSSYNPQGDIADPRFGYKGLIYGTNEVAGIYILGLAYFYRQTFRYRESKNILLIMTCLAAVLTGTKATLLGFGLITSYYFVKYRLALFIVLLIPVFLTLAYLIVKHWQEIKSQYLSFNVYLFEKLDLITFLMSGRNTYIETNLEYIRQKWPFIQYITGDAFLYSETDLLDLYFFFGVGAFFYLFIYMKVYFLKDKSVDNLFNFMVLMAIAFTAGHIIQSAIVPVFLLLYVFSARTKVSHAG